MEFFLLPEADIGTHPARCLDVFQLDFFHLFGPRGGLLGLGGVGGETADKLLQVEV
jgi:hypothetical protein